MAGFDDYQFEFFMNYWLFFWISVINKRRNARERARRLRVHRRIQYMHFFIEQQQQLHLSMLRMLDNEMSSRSFDRSVWVKPKRCDLWYDIMNNWERGDWLKNVRMSKATFLFICRELEHTLSRKNTRLRRPIPVGKRIVVALWRLATNIEYRTLGHLFGIGRSTACLITKEVCEAVVEHLMPKYIRLPQGEDFRQVVDGFHDRWGFPQVGGAIDGSHIPIVAPPEHHCDYFNRKGWHSVIMQGVVDHRYRFMDVQVGWPGGVHDARVFANSGLFIKGNDGTLFPDWKKEIGGVQVPIYLLGDPAYPLLPWLMKPFPRSGNISPAQRRYNYRQSRARMVVENAFGRLKGRWRCLLKRYDCHISMIPATVGTCCTLHNICETHFEEFNDEWLSEVNNTIQHLHIEQPDRCSDRNCGSPSAVEIRNAIVSWIDNTE